MKFKNYSINLNKIFKESESNQTRIFDLIHIFLENLDNNKTMGSSAIILNTLLLSEYLITNRERNLNELTED